MKRSRDDALIALAEAAALDAETAWAGRAEEDALRISRIRCCAGCAYCCYLLVRITAAEAERIADFVFANFGNLKRKSLEARIGKIAGVSAERRLAEKMPCAFLADGKCSIYDVRPLACRAWNSADETACRRMWETANLREPVPVYAPQKRLFDEAFAGLLAKTGGGEGELSLLLKERLSRRNA